MLVWSSGGLSRCEVGGSSEILPMVVLLPFSLLHCSLIHVKIEVGRSPNHGMLERLQIDAL